MNLSEEVKASSTDMSSLIPVTSSGSYRPEGVAPFTYGLWRHFVLLGVLHLIWLFVLLVAQMAGYHGFDAFVAGFLGLGGR